MDWIREIEALRDRWAKQGKSYKSCARALTKLLSAAVDDGGLREAVDGLLSALFDQSVKHDECECATCKRVESAIERTVLALKPDAALTPARPVADPARWELCPHDILRRDCKVCSPRPEPAKRPRIVCLCGSTRFTTDMACISWALERDEGYIVLGWHLLPADHPDLQGTDGSHGAEAVGRKEHFDELHKRKIDLADEVFVINVGGYIGESTRSEIEYAKAHGKPVRYLEPGKEGSHA